MERSSYIYNGIASNLVATYSTGISKYTGGYDCSKYDRLIAYVTTANRVSSGIVAITVQFSHDNETFYDPPIADVQSIDGAAGNYVLHFASLGKYFRIKAAYASGTSIDITAMVIEAKS